MNRNFNIHQKENLNSNCFDRNVKGENNLNKLVQNKIISNEINDNERSFNGRDMKNQIRFNEMKFKEKLTQKVSDCY